MSDFSMFYGKPLKSEFERKIVMKIRVVKSPSVPKFVVDLMSRAKYDYGANSEAFVPF